MVLSHKNHLNDDLSYIKFLKKIYFFIPNKSDTQTTSFSLNFTTFLHFMVYNFSAKANLLMTSAKKNLKKIPPTFQNFSKIDQLWEHSLSQSFQIQPLSHKRKNLVLKIENFSISASVAQFDYYTSYFFLSLPTNDTMFSPFNFVQSFINCWRDGSRVITFPAR